MAAAAAQDGGQRASTDSQTHLLPCSSSLPWPSSSPSSSHPDVMAGGGQGIDDDRARRILRRIDARIMPLLFLTATLNFTDKAILASAAVFGLREDTRLVGSQYAWAAAAFYAGYLLWNCPAATLVPRLPVAKYLGANTLLWGAVVAGTAGCTDFAGLFVARLLLGAAEAAVVPCLVFVTAAWFTRDEIPVRTGIWFAGNSLGGIAASLLAFAVGSLASRGHGWRWMFGVLGILTFALGVALLLFLPDSISSARFLDPEERRWARDRVVIAGLGTTEKAVWRWDQTRECFVDPKTWVICAISLLCQIPNGGTQNFANLVITSFGLSPLQSTLINIPYSMLSIAAITGTGWVAGRFRSMNCILIALVVLPPVVGSALISHRASVPRGVSLFGYFLLATGPSALPLLLSLVQSNFRGTTKKITMTALLFVAYCAGNITGPQLFIEAESPTYDTAFRAILVCYALVIGFVLGLRVYLRRVNRRRRAVEGSEGCARASGAGGVHKVVHIGPGHIDSEAVGELRLRPEDYEDVTDWKTMGFRYRL